MISVFFKKKKFKQTIKKKKPNFQHFFKKKKFFFLCSSLSINYLYVLNFFFNKKKKVLLSNYLGFIKLSFFLKKHNIFGIYSDLGMFNKAFSYNNYNYFLCLVSKGTIGFNFNNNGIKVAFAKKSFFFVKGSGKKFIKMVYPSKKEVVLNKYDMSFFTTHQFYKNLKKKIVVRGIAKNPVDHPNGGNSNTKQPLKTP